jgi:hypothetical protein
MVLAGTGCLPYCLSAWNSYVNKLECSLAMTVAKIFFIGSDRTGLSGDVIQDNEKKTERKIFFANGEACAVLSAAIIAMRVRGAL